MLESLDIARMLSVCAKYVIGSQSFPRLFVWRVAGLGNMATGQSRRSAMSHVAIVLFFGIGKQSFFCGL